MLKKPKSHLRIWAWVTSELVSLPAPLHLSHQGQIYSASQARCRDHSPALMTLGTALLVPPAGKGERGKGGHLSCADGTIGQEKAGARSSLFMPFVEAHPHPCHHGQLYCAAH